MQEETHQQSELLDTPSETTGEAQERSPLCDHHLSKHGDVGVTEVTPL